MPRTAEQNQAIKDKRRSKLLSYALKAFAANGYDHTAIDDITKPSKCSHGLFYHYFESKEVVFRALIEDVIMQADVLPIQKAYELGGVEGLHELIKFGASIEKGGLKDIAIAEIIIDLPNATSLDEFAREFADANNPRRVLADLIKQGQDQGKVIDGDPNKIADILIDLLLASFKRFKTKTGGFYREELVLSLLLK